MRIETYGHLSGPSRTKAKASTAGSAFSLSDADESSAAGSTSKAGAQQAVSLGALLSLQISGGETIERRAAKAGSSLLDDLADLQSSLLAIDEAPEVLLRLRSKLPDLQMTGDATLDPILREIDLRARVELAKRGL